MPPLQALLTPFQEKPSVARKTKIYGLLQIPNLWFLLLPSTAVHGTRRKQGKRKRTAFTLQQIRILWDAYSQNCRPSTEERENIARMTGLTTRIVRVWFQNRRCAVKRAYSCSSPDSIRALVLDHLQWNKKPDFLSWTDYKAMTQTVLDSIDSWCWPSLMAAMNVLHSNAQKQDTTDKRQFSACCGEAGTEVLQSNFHSLFILLSSQMSFWHCPYA